MTYNSAKTKIVDFSIDEKSWAQSSVVSGKVERIFKIASGTIIKDFSNSFHVS